MAIDRHMPRACEHATELWRRLQTTKNARLQVRPMHVANLLSDTSACVTQRCSVGPHGQQIGRR